MRVIWRGKLWGRRKLDKEKIKLEFLQRITAGESHTAITDDDHMPDWSTIYRWAKQDKVFAADIADAKFERGCHYGYLVGEIGLDLWHNADKQTHEMVAAKRGAGDLLKWSAARMAGKDGWTDKIAIEHQGQQSFVEALKAINTEDRLQEVRAQGISETDNSDKASLH
jgi:hypothetical protein